MVLKEQILFFFSALGAFNGLFISLYFAVNAQKKQFSNYFISLLFLSLSIRIIKSVFFYFNSHLAGVFIQIGLSGCILIGPFLFLYLKSIIEKPTARWSFHILPFLVGITVLGIIYPYVEYKFIWSRWIVRGIYLQWFIYICMSFKYVRESFIILLKKKQQLSRIDIWLVSVFLGVAFVWVAYSTTPFTSYIVGAVSTLTKIV